MPWGEVPARSRWRWAAAAAMVLVAAAPGCVERLLQIRSDPPGAEVTVNGEPAGVTPVDHPFIFYGTFDVSLRARGCRSVHALEPVPPPWYQIFPLDFIAEHLMPLPIKGCHGLDYRLEKVPLGGAEGEREEKAAVVRMHALQRQLDRPVPGSAPQRRPPPPEGAVE